MSNLIAYIPALNQRHLDWFARHRGSMLYLISQEMAESLIPRLSRNMAAIPTVIQQEMIKQLKSPYRRVGVSIFDPSNLDPNLDSSEWGTFVLPDEDVSHAVVERYFPAPFTKAQFESIWARWDMNAVKRQSPLMVGIDVTYHHQLRMAIARKEAEKSPDWWRQIGAAVCINGSCVATGHNEHYPTEYEQDMKGDPRGNFEAGQPGKYLSLHAEMSSILQCAYRGISTRGAILYTTVFPCENCAYGIVKAGIDHVFFEEGYSALNAQEVLQGAGVQLTQVIKDPELG